MRIPDEGTDSEALFVKLAAYRKDDAKWRDGRAFTPTFAALDRAGEVAERAFRSFLWDNALDPTLYPSVMRLETEVVAMAASHLGGGTEVTGNFTSGGTESVMLAIKTTRDRARALRPEIERPRIVLPSSAHPCFRKGAHYFDLQCTVVPVDPRTLTADVDAMRDAITDDTIMIAGSAPCFGLGVVDPIAPLGELALQRNIAFHVDGCIGGFLLPYFRRLGRSVEPFGFDVPGVTSMSMDLHKYAYAPKGASVVLYKDAEFRKHQIFTCSGWPGYTLVNATMQSSRSAGPLAAAWALLHHFGDEGYLEIARELAAATDRLVAGIESIPGLRLLAPPAMTLVPITSDAVDVFALSEELPPARMDIVSAAGVRPDPQQPPRRGRPAETCTGSKSSATCSPMPSSRRAAPPRAASSMDCRVALAGADVTNLTDGQIGELLAFSGMGAGTLPDNRAEVYALLETLPTDFRDRVLTLWFNELCRHHPVE